MVDVAKCEGCLLDGCSQPFEPEYQEDSRFLVVVDKISAAGHRDRRAISPGQKKMLMKHMDAEQFSPDEFDFIPAVLCPYDVNDYTNKQEKAIRQHCRVHMLDEVRFFKPEAVISLGADATKQAMGQEVKITRVRGLGQEMADLPGIPLLPILSPGQALMHPETEPYLASDIAAFGRLVDARYNSTQAGSVDIGEFEVLDDLQVLLDADPELVAFDTETTGLNWFARGLDVRGYREKDHKDKDFYRPGFHILCMSFTIGPGKAYVLPWDMPGMVMPAAKRAKLRNQLRKLLCDPKRTVVGHNVKFDCTALWATTGIRFRIGGDSLMLAAVHDENAMNKDLASMVKIHTPDLGGYSDWFDAKYDKSRMWQVPWNDMIPYVGGDTIAAYELFLALEDKVAKDEKSMNHYDRVSIPGLNAFSAIEMRGMYTDDEIALPQFREYMTHEVERMRNSLMDQIPKSIKLHHVNIPRFKGNAAEALKLSRPEFLRDILFDHPDGFRLTPVVFTGSTKDLNDKSLRQPSVSSKDHLPYFFDECPFTMELAEYIKANDLLNKSVINFKDKYIHGGKVRPKYSLSKTVTRRSSSMDPNGQNYPKRGQLALTYRKMFVAPEDHFVIENDLSQAEIRIAGDMAGDPTIIKIYQENGDIHTATACIVLGVTEEQFRQLPKAQQKDARSKAKAVNFGFLYGMGWRKFIGFAKTQYGVEFTETEAKRIRVNFFKKYSRLETWHERMRAMAKKHKQVRSYSGLARHLPMVDSPEEGIQAEAGRQAINSPVQEFGSTIGVIALGRMNEEIDPQYLEVVGFIHDAIVAYAHKDYIDWGMRTLKEYMESAPLEEWFGTKMKIKMVAEAGFGHNMGEIHELEGFEIDKSFDYDTLRDKDGKLLIEVPPQKIPPNNGRLTRSPYTTPADLEDESVQQPGDDYTNLRLTRSAQPRKIVRKMVPRTLPKHEPVAQVAAPKTARPSSVRRVAVRRPV